MANVQQRRPAIGSDLGRASKQTKGSATGVPSDLGGQKKQSMGLTDD